MKKSRHILKGSVISAAMLVSPFLMNAASAAEDVDISIPVQAFADVGYFVRSTGAATNSSATSTDTIGRDGAFVGTLTMFATPQIGDRVRGLLEGILEYTTAGSPVLTMERVQIGYAFSDAAMVWAGRFHSPYGYWNTAYHHGAQLQPSIVRPVMLSGALPAHTIGLWVTGRVKAGEGKLTYDAYAGNATRVAAASNSSFPSGPTSTGSIDSNHAAEDNQNKNLGFNLGYTGGGALDGLRVGVHGLVGKFGDCATAAASQTPCTSGSLTKTKFKMYGPYVHYDNYNLEVLGELFLFKNTNVGETESKSSSAGFLQVGYFVLPDLIPYVRVEKTSYDQTDNYFKTLSRGKSYRQDVLGVRYNLNTNATFKVEANRTKSGLNAGLKESKELRVQYAIRF